MFVIEKGGTLAIFMALCLCQKRGVELKTTVMALCLYQRRGRNLAHLCILAGLRQIFMHYRIKLWAAFIYCYINLEVFMPYCNLEQTRDITQNMINGGR